MWESWGNVLVAWVIGIAPVMLGACWLYRLRLRRGLPRAEALRFTIAESAILLGTLPWVWMILTPIDAEGGLLLVPLRDLFETLSDTPTHAVVQVVPNMIVFAPLGFFLPLRFPQFAGVLRMTIAGAAFSASLELAQYVLDLGRFSSVDDVLMNAAGAGIGAWLSAVHVRRRGAGRVTAPTFAH